METIDDKNPEIDRKEQDPHPLRTRNTAVDIAEELDSLIPDELIRETPCNHVVKPIMLGTLIYIIAIIVSCFVLVIREIKPYSLLPTLIFFVAYPLSCAAWIYRVKKNNMALGVRRPFLSPFWSGLLMIIPVSNSLSIFAVYQELWKTSVNPVNWDKVRNNHLITAWYIVRLISLGVTLASALMYESLEARENPLVMECAIPLTVVASVMEITILLWIARMQTNYRLSHPPQKE